jgi:hypothetical protein
MDTHERSFVTGAVVVGKLDPVEDMAWKITLAAINARVLSARAGSAASGFNPIMDFMDQVGRDTVVFVERINKEALSASRVSVSAMRARRALASFSNAHNKIRGTDQEDRLNALVLDVAEEARSMDEAVDKQMRILLRYLDLIKKHMRSVAVVSTSCRVESIQVGAYRKHLDQIADTVDKAAEDIKAIILDSRETLLSNN